MAVQDVLPVCTLPIISWSKLHIIPKEVGTINNTYSEHISVQAGVVKYITCGEAVPFTKTLRF